MANFWKRACVAVFLVLMSLYPHIIAFTADGIKLHVYTERGRDAKFCKISIYLAHDDPSDNQLVYAADGQDYYNIGGSYIICKTGIDITVRLRDRISGALRIYTKSESVDELEVMIASTFGEFI